MGTNSYRKKKNNLPPFVPLTWEMLNSIAYRKLKHAAAKALPYFLGKIKGNYNDPQRYQIPYSLSYQEGKGLGFANATFFTIIEDLVNKGFIDPVDKGGLRSDGKSYNLFRLSRRWEKYGREGFEQIDWKSFLPRLPRKKPTLESENHSINNGKNIRYQNQNISKNDAVGA